LLKHFGVELLLSWLLLFLQDEEALNLKSF
jgi:hypothetical protein